MNIETHWRNRLDALFADKEHATTKEMVDALNVHSHRAGWSSTVTLRLAEIGYPVLHVGRNSWVKVA